MTSRQPSLTLLAALVLVGSGAQARPLQDAGLDFFENEIRPLFADTCVRCHGPKKQKGGLRLDRPEGILAGGEGGAILVPGDAEASRLVHAIRYLDEDLQMPPRTKLDEEEIAAVVRWIDGGAALPASEGRGVEREAFDLEARKQHWSFQALTDPEVPATDSAWPRDDVDRFILRGLSGAGLAPSEEAQPADWLRRVHFTLIGLPPSPETVRRFAADDSPAAREAIVDELLASPHFGERWGRHWLDLVRYAETRGHEFDYVIPNAWQYRDYVVRAFNGDVALDRLVQEHIAGDLLPQPRLDPTGRFDESILGTGFWFLGDGAHSPVDIRADETDRVANQVDVFSRAFLGLTVACARCHDHKFDPITAEDFYALSGYVMGGSYRQARFETLASEEKAAARLAELKDRHRPEITRTLLDALEETVQSRAPYQEAAREFVDGMAWPQEEGQPVPPPEPEQVEQFAADAGLDPSDLRPWIEEWILARGNEDHPLHTMATEQVSTGPVAPSPGEVGPLLHGPDDGPPVLRQDGSSARLLPAKGGKLLLGDEGANGWLTQDAIHFDVFWNRLRPRAGDESESTATRGILPGRMVRTETFEITEPSLHVLVRGRGFLYAAVDGHRLVAGPLHAALCKGVDTGGPFEWVQLDLGDYVGHRVHLEFSPHADSSEGFAVGGLVQGSVPTRKVTWGDRSFSAAARALSQGTEGHPVDGHLVDWMLQRPALFPIRDDEYLEASRAYARELETLAAGRPWEAPSAPVMLEGNGVDEFLLLRGNASTPAHAVPRRFLEALDGKRTDAPPAGSGRLELARRVTSDANPFLSRVWANRLWHHVFGLGLVASVDDFGVMGQAPSHPELLDYLAQELKKSGWSTKAMLRRLVLSRTYAMASEPVAAAQEVDPDNRLLHRMPVRRLEAEALRDTILAVSGTLDPALSGPSVPVHLTAFTDGRGRPGQSGPMDGAGRRSLYLSVRRNFPVPFLGVFDFPNPAATMGRRGNSNVPAQALTLLNDPFVQQEAERWARRALAGNAVTTAEERVGLLYLEAFGRAPMPEELAVTLGYLTQRMDQGGTPVEAWSEICHVLINTKEFRYLR